MLLNIFDIVHDIRERYHFFEVSLYLKTYKERLFIQGACDYRPIGVLQTNIDLFKDMSMN